MDSISNNSVLLSNIALANEKDFWKETFTGFKEKITFPYDSIGINSSSNDFEEIPIEVDEEANLLLQKISGNSDIRMFIILCTNLAHLLYKYTGKADVTFGIPIEKQNSDDNFLNTLIPIRCNINGESSIRESLNQIKKAILDGIQNQDFPIKGTSSLIGLPESTDRDFELFDIIITHENIHIENFLNAIYVNNILYFDNKDGRLSGRYAYRGDRYDKNTVQNISKCFMQLLSSSLKDISTNLKEISLLSEEQYSTYVRSFNDTRTARVNELTAIDLIQQHAENTPDNISVIDGEQEISYKELIRQVDNMAHFLQSDGVKSGDTVAVLGHRSIEIIVSILGVLKSGASYIPINAQDPGERIKYILEYSQCNRVILQKHVIDKRGEALEGFQSGILMTEDFYPEIKSTQVNNKFNTQAGLNQKCYTIFTSGSTGKPKGVEISHKALMNYLRWTSKEYIKESGRVNFPFYTSFSFDMSITSLFTPLTSGNRIIVYGGGEKEFILDRVINDERINILKATPTHLKLIREKYFLGNGEYNKLENSKIEKIIVGGENLESSLAKDICSIFNNKIDIFNEYGPTEATVGCMIHKYNPKEDTGVSVPIGKPIDNTEIYLLDRDLNPIAPGMIGEMYIAGDSLATSYLKNPELTNASFIDNSIVDGTKMYKTGDLAKWISPACIEYVGRRDSQVKIRGYRIELAEIENVLNDFEGIRETVVYCDTAKNNQLIAYCISDTDFEAKEIKTWASSILPDYMVPSLYAKIEKIPYTSSGKIDLKKLPGVDAFQKVFIAPRNEKEIIMQRLWSEVLSVDKEKVSMDSNFFELGGNSISTVTLMSRVHRYLNIKPTMEQIFRFPTIESLVKVIEDGLHERFTPIKIVEKKEYYPVNSVQKEFYFMQMLNNEDTSINISFTYTINGFVDVESLEKSILKLINRHVILRTSFSIIDKQVVQYINKQISFKIQKYSCLDIEKDQVINSLNKPIKLDEAPLVRVQLITITDKQNKQLLVISMPHIISDGISSEMFIRELNSIENKFKLPKTDIQYYDFCNWKYAREQKGRLKEAKEYWLNELSGDLPELNLPYDYKNKPLSIKGGVLIFNVEQKETALLKQFADSNNSSLYCSLFSILYILLKKISNQSDIVVRSITSGRDHSDLENVMGLFINTIGIRLSIDEKMSFAELSKTVKDKLFSASKHQEYPFTDLVKALEKKQVIKDKTLSPVVFNLSRQEFPELKLNGLTSEPYYSNYETAYAPLMFDCWENGDEIRFLLSYQKNHFKHETAKSFVRGFLDIIKAVTNNFNIQIKDISTIFDETDSCNSVLTENLDESVF